MAVLSEEDLSDLLEKAGYPAISIYMPTHRTGDISQDQIRLKNLLGEAETQLKKQGSSSREIKELLEGNPDAVKHTFIEGRLVLTASTKELQAFILKYADDPKVFTDEIILGRREMGL